MHLQAPLQKKRARSTGPLLVTILFAIACNGQVLSPQAGDDDDDDTNPQIDDVALELPLARVWRLTPRQYERSFVAAFGTTSVGEGDFSPDAAREGFDDLAEQNHVDIVWAELAQRNAAQVATELTEELRTDQPCLIEDTPTRECIAGLVEPYASRAFRRPLDSELQDSLIDLFLNLREAGNSPDAAISAVLESIAQSPFFTYRIETGVPAGPGIQALDSYAIASELSYMLTDSPPDEELMAAAAADQLLDREIVLEHAKRLLDTPESLEKVSRFFEQYLGTGALRNEIVAKDKGAYPNFSPEIQAAMVAETDRFVEKVAFAEFATLLDVFTSPVTYVDDSLRAFYNWNGSATPNEPFTIPGEQRAGVFMQGSVLSARSASIKTDVLHRGLYIYRRLLCQDIAPPAGLDIFELADVLEPPDPESTERQRLEYLVDKHIECGGCHTNFVPLGLSLETFDATGVFRSEQNGRPLDTTGELALRKEAGGSFGGAADLFRMIAQSDQGQACFAENWATFAFGSDIKVPAASTLVTAFQESDLRIRDLLLLITQQDAFYLRREEESP